MKRYISKSNTNLKFWVESNSQYFPANSERIATVYMIVSQVKGYDATEACSEHFKYKKDAEEIAQQMAEQS
jgi:hypothetical protein